MDEDTGDGGAHIPQAFVDVHRVIQETVSYYARVVVLVVSDRSRVALETARLGARNPQIGGAEYPQITRWNGLERALQRAVRRAKAPILYTKRLRIPRMGGSGVKVEDLDASSCLRQGRLRGSPRMAGP